MERDPRLRAVEIREYTGNSEATARKHYSTVTREDRQQAATDWPEQSSGPTVDDGSHQKASDRTAKETGLPRTRRKERSELIRTDSEKNKVHPEGVSLVPENTTEIFKCRFRGATRGTINIPAVRVNRSVGSAHCGPATISAGVGKVVSLKKARVWLGPD